MSICRRSKRSAPRGIFAGSVALALAVLSIASATPATSAEPDARYALFLQSIKHPKDIKLALAYAKACVDLQDYEGAIGALERVLIYAPNDQRVKADLGFIYDQMHSHQMARHYFDDALARPGLDAETRARIAAIGDPPDVAEAATANRLYGSLQTGVRYQSNAAFNPDNNLLTISNQDFLVAHPQEHGADGNVFGAVDVGYDYTFGNHVDDVIEMRLTGYGTAQFRFDDLNVGLYDLSIGPRFVVSPEFLPGASIKPYVAGGQVFLAGQRYLASYGAGIVADLPVRPNLAIQPGAEVRRAQFSNVSVYSSFNTGTFATVSLAARAEFNDTFGASTRIFYTRDSANEAYQTSDNVAEQFALVARFGAPLKQIDLPWSVSPYVKFLQTSFDAPNPFIDSRIMRRDNEFQYGFVLDTPINDAVGVVTNVEEAKIASNIPNYRLHNLTVLLGPTVRF